MSALKFVDANLSAIYLFVHFPIFPYSYGTSTRPYPISDEYNSGHMKSLLI